MRRVIAAIACTLTLNLAAAGADRLAEVDELSAAYDSAHGVVSKGPVPGKAD